MAKELEIKAKNLVSAEAFRKAFSRIYDLFVRRKEGYGLSKNDFTDNHRIKLENLENYILPPATKKSLGGIIAGDGLTVGIDGKLSVLFPDLSRYVTFGDMKKDNGENEIRFSKIEKAAEQKQNDDNVFKKSALARIGNCENKITETNKAVAENLKRFDNYVSLTEHDEDINELRETLGTKADATTLDNLLKRKITKSDLDGNLNNLIDIIRTEQDRAAEDRANLRSVKTDIASLNNLRHLVQENSEDINLITQGMQSFITADALKGYVVAEPGKMLSERSFTNEDWDKLQSLHNYTLPVANQVNIGGVKAGDNVNIADDGTISVAIPTVKDFMSKDDSQKITDALDKRLTDCENNSAQQNGTLNTMSSSMSAAQKQISTLEDAAKKQTAVINGLATKTELADNISALDKAKVNVADFERHVNTKITADKLSADINNKLDETVTMSVNIGYLQKAVKSVESDAARCFDRLKTLNSLITAIRADMPDSKTYVRALPGKSLSTNDFTDVMKERLASAITNADVGIKVVGLNADNKIDEKYMPDSLHNILCVDDVATEGTGSQDILYFNRADKKLYYFDGVNFQQTRNGLYNDNGIDLRTEMADRYISKVDIKNVQNIIGELKNRIDELEILAGIQEKPVEESTETPTETPAEEPVDDPIAS